MPVEVAYSGEGATDAAIARRILRHAGGLPGIDYCSRRRSHGKSALDRSLAGLNAAARWGNRLLVLRDQDFDTPCPGTLVGRLLPQRHQNLCLRIAVRSVESWLMADRDGFAKAAGVRPSAVPEAPELLADPKSTLIALLRNSSRRDLRRISEPPVQPQLLAAFLIEFCEDGWNPARAAAVSPSLARALERTRGMLAGSH